MERTGKIGFNVTREREIMEDFQIRVRLEYTELMNKYLTLGTFLCTQVYRDLPVNESNLLALQHNVMGTYVNILEMRIANYS